MSETIHILEAVGDTSEMDAIVSDLCHASPEAQPIYEAIGELVRGIHEEEGATWEAWQMAEISYRLERLIRSLRPAIPHPVEG